MLTFSALSNSAFAASNRPAARTNRPAQASDLKPSAPVRFGASDAESSIQDTPTRQFNRSMQERDWARNAYGFQVAAHHADLQTLRDLLDKQDKPLRKVSLVNTTDEYTNMAPLHLLADSLGMRNTNARTDLLEVTELLLRHGADINAKDDLNKTPLMLAALKGDLNMVSILLANRANKRLADSDGYTALHYAQASAPYRDPIVNDLLFRLLR